jgi:hypothetical protein
MRVPLLNPVGVIITQLDPDATRVIDPPGSPSAGYDDVLGEPVLYDDPATAQRTSPVQYMSEIKVPCQVEVASFERLRMHFAGNCPDSNIVLILHRMHLEELDLIDVNTGRTVLKPMDMIVRIEKLDSDTIVQTFQTPLYIFEVRPGSWGFGPDGHDLELIYTTLVAPNTARQR